MSDSQNNHDHHDHEAYLAGYREGFVAGFREGHDESYLGYKRRKYLEKQAKHEYKHAYKHAERPAVETRAKKGRVAHEATITGRRQLSPDLVRLSVNSPGLRGMDLPHSDHYIKILFVPEGADYAWPFDLAEVRHDKPKHMRPITRTYTLRSVDTVTGDAEIDFVIHGDFGVAGPWARDARVGEKFGFAGPGGGWAPTPDYEHFVLAGDESAAPAIAAGIEKLPEGATATALVEIEAPGREFEMPTHPGLDFRWIYRNGAMPGSALVDAVRSADNPAKRTAWFVHGVAEMIKPVRRFLYVERKISKKDASVSGYWRLKMTEDQWQETKGQFVAQMDDEEARQQEVEQKS